MVGAIAPRVGTVFVTGAMKTCTSSVLATLNAHPDVLVLYEVRLYDVDLSRRAHDFLSAFPDARHLFRPTVNYPEAYEGLASWLESRGRRYTLVGDKVPSLNPEVLRRTVPAPVIYCVRDIRTWLAKQQVRKQLLTDHDVVPAAVAYATQFVESFRLPRVLHVPTEAFVTDNGGTLAQVGNFLGLDIAKYAANWWETFHEFAPDDPKSAIKWWSTKHQSSLAPPQALDTRVALTDHSFWDAMLPLFDRFYARLNTRITGEEINEALLTLRSLGNTHSAPFSDVFSSVEYRNVADEGQETKPQATVKRAVAVAGRTLRALQRAK